MRRIVAAWAKSGKYEFSAEIGDKAEIAGEAEIGCEARRWAYVAGVGAQALRQLDCVPSRPSHVPCRLAVRTAFIGQPLAHANHFPDGSGRATQDGSRRATQDPVRRP